jgi:flagellum-specific ATP synthase
VSLASLLEEVREIPEYHRYGRVTGVSGLLLEIGGVPQSLAVGGRCEIVTRDLRRVPCEVVGFRDHRALAMPFGALEGVSLGCKAEVLASVPAIHPSDAWLGRVVNAF